METEEIFDRIGAFGRYQKLILVIIGLNSAFVSMNAFGTVFLTGRPDLICEPNFALTNETQRLDTCKMWSNYSQTPQEQIEANNSAFSCHFDDKYYKRSVVTDFGLVCDRLFMSRLTQTIYAAGGLIGGFAGVISDRFGRRIVCIGMSIAMSLTLLIGEILQLDVLDLSQDSRYSVYVVAQFVMGLGAFVLYVNSYVLLVEITTSKYKVFVSNINSYIYVGGELITLVVAYFSRNWHTITWTFFGYSVIVVILNFFLPESPRFLLSKGKLDDANRLLKTIARVNGKISPSDASIIPVEKINPVKMSEKEDKKAEVSAKSELYNFFRDYKNIIQVSMCAYTRIAVQMVYFGVGLSITSIGNIDPYMAFLISAIAELVGYLLCLLNDKFGRRRMLASFYLFAGLICASVSAIPKPTKSEGAGHWKSVLTLLFATIGRAMISGAATSSYIFTSQLYPTRMRGTLLFLITCVGKVGSLISPQINLLQDLVWKPLPYLIFGVSSLLASLFVVFIPNVADYDK